MGQMTTAIMLGHEAAPPESMEDGWYSLTSKFKPGKGGPRADCSYGEVQVIGFWIAVGASGMEGVPDMPECIALDGIKSAEPFKQQIAQALAPWGRLVDLAAKMGAKLPKAPRLYLVQTEVA